MNQTGRWNLKPTEAVSLVQALAHRFGAHSKQIIELSYGDNETPFFRDSLDKLLRETARVVIAGQYRTVLWDPQIRQAAIQGAEAFEGERIVAESLPQESCWWVYQEPLGFSAADYPDLKGWDVEHGWYLEAHYIYPSERIIGYEGRTPLVLHAHGMLAVWSNGTAIRVAWEPGVPYGESMPIHLAAVVAMQQFLDLPFVGLESHRPNHAQRKDAKRYKHPEPPPVHVVTLRRRESGHSEAGEGGRDYHCQWLVSGHWRRLHKPRKDGARVTYVTPHVKGPEGLPFKPPVKTVYAARR